MPVQVNGSPLSGERLRELLSYDPTTGSFYWLVGRGGVAAGSEAGLITPKGYRLIKVAGRFYMAHRLAWLYVHGAMPASEIDHRDGDRLNNRISNLRIATSSQNSANMRARVGRKLPKGVRLSHSGKRFEARITVERKEIHLGSFSTESDAHRAYCAAATQYFGDFARAA